MANHMVDRIAAETEAVIDEIMPSPHWLNHLEDAEPLRPNPSEQLAVAASPR